LQLSLLNVEALSSLSEVRIAHHIVSLNSLCTLGLNFFFRGHSWLGLSTHHRLHIWSNTDILRIILSLLPINLKFGYSRFFSQDVSGQLVNIWSIWWVFNQIGKFLRIRIIYIVTNSKKFLSSVIRASHQNCSHSDHVILRKLWNLRKLTLE